MKDPGPFHAGELAVQARANAGQSAQINGRAISNKIPTAAIRFISQQSMLISGSMDAGGNVWASVLFGPPGFISAADATTLILDKTAIMDSGGSSCEDPLWSNLQTNRNTGLLIIELESRRRLRVNGYLRNDNKFSGDHRLIIDVEQAFPNCPQYIQSRHMDFAARNIKQGIIPVSRGYELNDKIARIITQADTFFVASAHPQHGVDVSHRGGQPGFVTIINDKLLSIPDFAGNNMFNTLGNFVSYAHAGLVFIDFNDKCVLQLTGIPEIIWPQDDVNGGSGGTRRYWQFHIEAWQEYHIAADVNWGSALYSPHNP